MDGGQAARGEIRLAEPPGSPSAANRGSADVALAVRWWPGETSGPLVGPSHGPARHVRAFRDPPKFPEKDPLIRTAPGRKGRSAGREDERGVAGVLAMPLSGRRPVVGAGRLRVTPS